MTRSKVPRSGELCYLLIFPVLGRPTPRRSSQAFTCLRVLASYRILPTSANTVSHKRGFRGTKSTGPTSLVHPPASSNLAHLQYHACLSSTCPGRLRLLVACSCILANVARHRGQSPQDYRRRRKVLIISQYNLDHLPASKANKT